VLNIMLWHDISYTNFVNEDLGYVVESPIYWLIGLISCILHKGKF
jgi:hypothetical protein